MSKKKFINESKNQGVVGARQIDMGQCPLCEDTSLKLYDVENRQTGNTIERVGCEACGFFVPEVESLKGFNDSMIWLFREQKTAGVVTNSLRVFPGNLDKLPEEVSKADLIRNART